MVVRQKEGQRGPRQTDRQTTGIYFSSHVSTLQFLLNKIYGLLTIHLCVCVSVSQRIKWKASSEEAEAAAA